MRLLIFRHGETEANVLHLMHKAGDSIGLNDVGRQQAFVVARVCKEKGVQAVYSSPELRARETADIISGTICLKTVIIEILRERDWGDWAGKSWAAIDLALENMTLVERYTFVPPNGESWQDVENRLVSTLSSITQKDFETVAVVTHGGAMRALMPYLKDEPREKSYDYFFGNGEMVEFEYSEGKYKQVE